MPEKIKKLKTVMSRRDVVKKAAVIAVAPGCLSLARGAHAAGSDVIKVGLIGCGGRGTGAACNALDAAANAKIVALADAFEKPVEGAYNRLKSKYKDRIDVAKHQRFVGLDAYKGLIAGDVDVVLLALPSHFHPIHLKAAVEAGKHVFCEKPHGVDPTQVRLLIEAGEVAEKKNLSIVSGLCYRYDPKIKETIKRIHDGAIGDVRSIQETYMSGFSWVRPRQPGDTEMKYQVRNWYNFSWLSGDIDGLTLIHSVDKGSWVLGDKKPDKVWAMGGREVREDPQFGDVYDHNAITYEYADGVNMYAFVRQQNGVFNRVSDLVIGTKGRADLRAGRIRGETNWRYKVPNANKFTEEHKALFDGIKNGKSVNNTHYMALSTMLVVMARMSSYTGKAMTYDEAMTSTYSTAPAGYTWETNPPIMPDKNGSYPIAKPGLTKLER